MLSAEQLRTKLPTCTENLQLLLHSKAFDLHLRQLNFISETHGLGRTVLPLVSDVLHRVSVYRNIQRCQLATMQSLEQKGVILADRLYWHDTVIRLSVCLSVTMCIVELRVGYGG